MQLKNCVTVLTGASGGIGQAIAEQLAQQGARLMLVGRNQDKLRKLQQQLQQQYDAHCITIATDISLAIGRQQLLEQIYQHCNRVDLLINNAGISDFHAFDQQSSEQIEQMYATNVLAPLQLSHALLPNMLAHGKGRIVNIGSTFGSIGFAYFATYSSSKFALRGFSEALSRELKGSGVEVSYIAPRAVKTQANSAAVYEMAQATKMKMDEPEEIGRFIVHCIRHDKHRAYYGWPEKLFVRINALLPRLVDRALSKQNRIMSHYLPKH